MRIAGPLELRYELHILIDDKFLYYYSTHNKEFSVDDQ